MRAAFARELGFRPKPSYTAGDVALLLGCLSASVTRAMDAGELPWFRPGAGARRRVRHGQLVDYLEGQPGSLAYRRALAPVPMPVT